MSGPGAVPPSPPDAVPHLVVAPERGAAAASLTDAFEKEFGQRPDGVWSAPGRVNLIGEHVDYTGGLCLPLALPHRTAVAVRAREDGRIRLAEAGEPGWEGTLDDVGPGTPSGWPGYLAGVAWAMASLLPGTVPGFDAMLVGGVPQGSGLSSSAALECSLAVALADLSGLGPLDDALRVQLAAACVRAENEVVGAPTGGLDQAASLRCREGAAMLLDCRDFSVRHVPFDLDAAGLALLVMDTRAAHSHAGGEYGQRRASLESACGLLGVGAMRDVPFADLDAVLGTLPDDVTRRRVRHAVTEIERVRAAADLLDAGRVGELGPLLDASHASLRDDYEVSSAELDLAVASARAAGALGARMTGGGFGGSAIALVPGVSVGEVSSAVASAFAARGWREPQFLLARASAGAGRDA